MALLFTLLYILSISACGCFFLRKWEMDPVLLFPAGFIIGSILMGGGMFFLISMTFVSPIPVCILVSGELILGAFGLSAMFRSLKAIKHFLSSRVYQGRYRVILLTMLLAGLALYLASAYTPPRGGDAMRYHLAQIKDIVSHKGFIYRPYYHYNFPQYFHYLFIPLFMAVGGIGVKLAVYFYFILVVLVTLCLAARTEQTKQLLFLALFFTFTPLCIREATVVNNDFAAIFYALVGLLLIIEFRARFRMRYAILAYVSFGFALGCKYQAVLYLPIYILATVLAMRSQWKFSFKYAIVIPLIIISFLIASPFFIRNFYFTGDPVWPLLQDLFHVKKDYLYQITRANSYRWSGQLGLLSLYRSIIRMAKYVPEIIPFVWLLWIGYYFTHSTLRRFYKLASVIFFLSWFLLQPKMYPRFVIYIFPIIVIMSISFCEWFYGRRPYLGKLSYTIAVLCIIAGIGFSVFYSLDSIRYLMDRDLRRYHQSTWFYDQYQWINQNLEDDGKVLVIVSSGPTYYIDKEYLRADPELSGLIDWSAIKSVDEFRDLLRKLQVRYIFYEDNRNWKVYPGGSNMIQIIHKLKGEKDVSVLLEDDNVRLMNLRMLRKFRITSIFLLDLQQGGRPRFPLSLKPFPKA